jgi:hypothetical protein
LPIAQVEIINFFLPSKRKKITKRTEIIEKSLPFKFYLQKKTLRNGAKKREGKTNFLSSLCHHEKNAES